MAKRSTKGAAVVAVPGGADQRLLFRRFNVAPVTDDEREYVCQCVKRSHKRLTIKECFYNSQRTMLIGDTNKRLVYAEGRVRRGTESWIHHGWLTIGGKVVDLTLNAAAFGLKIFVPKHVKNDPRYVPGPARVPDEYVGAEFDRGHVLAFIRSGFWGALLSTIETLEPECEGVRDGD